MVVKKRAAKTRHFGQPICIEAMKKEVFVKKTKALK